MNVGEEICAEVRRMGVVLPYRAAVGGEPLKPVRDDTSTGNYNGARRADLAQSNEKHSSRRGGDKGGSARAVSRQSCRAPRQADVDHRDQRVHRASGRGGAAGDVVKRKIPPPRSKIASWCGGGDPRGAGAAGGCRILCGEDQPRGEDRGDFGPEARLGPDPESRIGLA